jgi:hypothetical protein
LRFARFDKAAAIVRADVTSELHASGSFSGRRSSDDMGSGGSFGTPRCRGLTGLLVRSIVIDV